MNRLKDTFKSDNCFDASITVETNCPCGGDAGHGGETKHAYPVLSQKDYDMNEAIKIVRKRLEGAKAEEARAAEQHKEIGHHGRERHERAIRVRGELESLLSELEGVERD